MSNLLDITMSTNALSDFVPLNSLDEEDIKLVNKESKFNSYKKRETLFHEGTDDDDVIFLVSGSIRLSTKDGTSFVLEADNEQAKYPVANLKPRRYSAKVDSETAAIARVPLKLLESLLSNSGQTQFVSSNNTIEHDSEMTVFDSDWMMAMSKTPLFRKIPSQHIHKLFRLMEEVKFKAGDSVVEQGEQGDYFYLIKKGHCLISRHNGVKEVELAEIAPTDSFGEEALLTETTRNATVRMLTNGRLMRLSKKDFQNFMHKPIVHWVDINEATLMVKNGAIKVDVRAEDQTKMKRLKNAVRIPMFMLRNHLKNLSRKNTYVLVCDDGKQSAAASYLFSLRGLDTYVLRGGLQSIQQG